MIYCEVFSLLIHNWSLVTKMNAKVFFFSCVLVSIPSPFSFPPSFRSVFYFHAYPEQH